MPLLTTALAVLLRITGMESLLTVEVGATVAESAPMGSRGATVLWSDGVKLFIMFTVELIGAVAAFIPVELTVAAVDPSIILTVEVIGVVAGFAFIGAVVLRIDAADPLIISAVEVIGVVVAGLVLVTLIEGTVLWVDESEFFTLRTVDVSAAFVLVALMVVEVLGIDEVVPTGMLTVEVIATVAGLVLVAIDGATVLRIDEVVTTGILTVEVIWAVDAAFVLAALIPLAVLRTDEVVPTGTLTVEVITVAL